MDKNKSYQFLKKFCLQNGAELFGVAGIDDLKDDFFLSDKVLQSVDKAVCLGKRISSGVLREIESAPTRLYFHHYRTINMFLDQLALKAAGLIEQKGFTALPIPASQIVDWQKQTAHLSHKKIGVKAGLGWIGRNNLLVNRKLGSRFRLVTILTNMPLKADKPVTDNCEDCRLCISACPAGAIKERAEDFDHIRCFEKLKEFQKQRLVDQYVCGVCVNACKGVRS
ncbi:MAG: 4Fe-4S binding protein [Candidatus Omnitrophica bacterium]|nr:4Fe-4S binding protein [Candidatus Omnitrophota bacterium]MDD5513299.1 4Fe-4S binding protein [Candidatus Omnitrophota bacterium]